MWSIIILESHADRFQLLVVDSEKRIALEDVEQHPWVVKHCKGSPA